MLHGIMTTWRFLATHLLTRDHRFAAFARLIRWQIQSRLSDEVVVPWIAGARLAVRRGMTGATGNIYAGLHEFADMAFLLHFLRRGTFLPMLEPISAAIRSLRPLRAARLSKWHGRFKCVSEF
jgi:hypothetical protein